MKPEFILKADILDILFENRNKEYGAYELRRHYDNRLKKSLGIVFLAILLLISSFILKNRFFSPVMKNPEMPIITDVDLASLDTRKTEIKQKEQPRQERKIAQTIFTKPLITRQVIVNPPPTQEQLVDKIISNKNSDGDKLQPNDIMPVHSGTSKDSGSALLPETAEPSVLDIAEFMPEFPGGLPALQRFLSHNLRTPRDDMEPGSTIKVLVRFVVDKDGSITGINIEQSGGKDFDNEVTRVMKKMPAWKPGRQNGRNVAVYFKIPVIFQAQDDH